LLSLTANLVPEVLVVLANLVEKVQVVVLVETILGAAI